jgi:hypothetical protein
MIRSTSQSKTQLIQASFRTVGGLDVMAKKSPGSRCGTDEVMRGVLIALAVITTATVRLACMHDSAIVLTLMMLIDADIIVANECCVWPSVIASKHPMHAHRAQNWLKDLCRHALSFNASVGRLSLIRCHACMKACMCWCLFYDPNSQNDPKNDRARC